MEFQMLVRFQHAERKLLTDKLLPNVGVGFPDDTGQFPREDALRRVRHVASGDHVRLEHVEEALAIAEATAAACAEQGTAGWWLEHVVHPTAPAGPRKASAVPLVANPEQFARDMAENRLSQMRQVCETRRLLEQARDALCSGRVPEPVEAVA